MGSFLCIFGKKEVMQASGTTRQRKTSCKDCKEKKGEG
jgi:hypothetical protein